MNAYFIHLLVCASCCCILRCNLVCNDQLRNIGNTEDLVDVATVLILEGSDGPHSHTAIGIGSDVTDAHNIARYHVPASVYMGIDAIYAYPNKK